LVLRFGPTTRSQETSNLRKTEISRDGEDGLGFVCAEPALGVNADLMVMWRKSSFAKRGIEMPVRKGGLVERRVVG